jgi:Fe-S-cluster-containing dehydrogenase component
MMAINRREFLKIAGWSALLGAGGNAAFELLAPGEAEALLQPAPLKAKQWAMAIDFTKMDEEVMGAAIKACHRLYNVPDMGNPKVELKWLWKETYEHAFPSQENEYIAEQFHHHNFLVLCNHCTNPPCCRACPTKATWRREDGIVMMDMHRCIGCRFCMAACPFGARSFNWGDPRQAPKELNPDFPTNPDLPTRSKGVVEKCQFCAERLAKGQIPACVEAANAVRTDAMFFGDLAVQDSPVRKVLRTRYSIRRKPELGTGPNVYYII